MEERGLVFPLHAVLYCTGDYAFARDIWYTVIVISYLLLFGRSMQVGMADTFARIAGRSAALQEEPDPDHVLRLEELRVRADDVARALDLEDGSATINAKFGNVEPTWDVEGGVDRLAFQAAFYETS